jgi:hypothetical protein
LIVYRRQRRLRSKVSKLEKNDYYQTGSQKIILFLDGGNILQVCSTDKKIIKISQFVIHKLTNQKIRYNEVISKFRLQKFKNFIDDMVAHKIDDCSLASLRMQNVSLKNSSPTIELYCEEDASQALDDLSTHNGLPLLDKIEEMQSFRMRLKERIYSIHTVIEDDEVILLIDNRNIRAESKDTLLLFLEKHLS